MNNIEVFRTELPSRAVLVYGIDQFVIVYTRTGSMITSGQIGIVKKVIMDVAELDLQVRQINRRFGPSHYVKLRTVMVDDKTGNLILYVDYLCNSSEEPIYSEDELKSLLGNGEVRHDGQGQWVEIRFEKALFSSESFSPVADTYYVRR